VRHRLTAGLARQCLQRAGGSGGRGAAWVEGGGRRYRPEPPAALVARISTDHGQASSGCEEFESISVPGTQTLVEVESGRAVLQLITRYRPRHASVASSRRPMPIPCSPLPSAGRSPPASQ
jgi:hypothetical protein